MHRFRSFRQTGFTTIELIVDIVVIAILLTVVFIARAGVAEKQRDDERQRDVAELRSNLEGYAQHDEYPTLEQINDKDWRKANMKGLDESVYSDPRSSANYELSEKPGQYVYTYQVKAADGNSCEDNKLPCTQYTLSAELEGGGRFTKNNLN